MRTKAQIKKNLIDLGWGSKAEGMADHIYRGRMYKKYKAKGLPPGCWVIYLHNHHTGKQTLASSYIGEDGFDACLPIGAIEKIMSQPFTWNDSKMVGQDYETWQPGYVKLANGDVLTEKDGGGGWYATDGSQVNLYEEIVRRTPYVDNAG